LRTFTLLLVHVFTRLPIYIKKGDPMLGLLRVAEAIGRTHILGTVVKVAATAVTKATKFLFHSNIGLIGLSALASRIGL
jgi:hypothetical protein